MSWTDKGFEDYERTIKRRESDQIKKLDLGDVYKWNSFITIINSNRKQYDAKVEYLARHGEVVTVTVTCLTEPMADFDITDSLSVLELERITDMAVHDLEQKR